MCRKSFLCPYITNTNTHLIVNLEIGLSLFSMWSKGNILTFFLVGFSLILYLLAFV